MTSMTLDPPLTNLLSPAAELVAGVDTHKNTHHVAILDLVGRPVADREFRADGRGYAQVIAFLHEHDDVIRVGVEGVGASRTLSTRTRRPSLSWLAPTLRSRSLVTGQWSRCGSFWPSDAPRRRRGRR